MRRAVPWVLLALMVLPAPVGGHGISDPIASVRVVGVESTPQLAPGEAGDLSLVVTNPYPFAMANVTLGVEIHEYRVDAFPGGLRETPVRQLASPPVFDASGDPALRLTVGTLDHESRVEFRHRIVTDTDTPGGGYFTQGTYLIRFRVAFDYEGGQTGLLLSPGHFSPEEWAYATRPDRADAEREAYHYEGDLNLSHLSAAYGSEVDGVLIDTGFGVKDPLPIWPFQLLAVGSAAAFGVALYYTWRERRGPPNL